MVADSDVPPTRSQRWVVAHATGFRTALVALTAVLAVVTALFTDSWASWLAVAGVALTSLGRWLAIPASRRHIEQYDHRHGSTHGPGDDERPGR
ncbi:hypothetical protein [Cellulomonas rhizosphaerae]|uniref:DUF3099 domain-containing protein n=1 Tax=Cellulomonas rhizosphaerae TaxID=2293719 RepID=A0A413RL68_9CELL|nr:hypothetical protein [Cellulomonas rhizosphaerae]RHA40499.1 hypothetical protein D1825_10215 [Cellulomonas rhizosphaerae]